VLLAQLEPLILALSLPRPDTAASAFHSKAHASVDMCLFGPPASCPEGYHLLLILSRYFRDPYKEVCKAQTDLGVHNLLSNALRYSPAQTSIQITAIEDGDMVRLSISDQGDGIPLEKQSIIFEKFVRLERDTHGEVRGTGLGLFITRQLVEAMCGTIRVVSSGVKKEGATFSLSSHWAKMVLITANEGQAAYSVDPKGCSAEERFMVALMRMEVYTTDVWQTHRFQS
jgi:hypothetical protein